MKIKTIFLDLDDVLNRFTMYALEQIGCKVDAYDDSSYNPKWGWNIVRAANTLPGHSRHKNKLSPKEFWNAINRKVWASVPLSAECQYLLDNCKDLVGEENVCILSCPTNDPECLAGKLEWIHEYMPPWLWRQYLIGPQKWMCARPDALLIDDSDANVMAFRKHGGQAVLVPRPWNILHGTHTTETLQQAFEIIKRSQ